MKSGFCYLVSGICHAGLIFWIGSQAAHPSNTGTTLTINVVSASESRSEQVSNQTSPQRTSTQKSRTNETGLGEVAATTSDQFQAIQGDGSGLVSGDSLGIRAGYPRLSRMLGETGSVVIEVHNDRGTSPGISATIHQSSGYSRLDQSALKAVLEADSSQIKSARNIEFIFRLVD